MLTTCTPRKANKHETIVASVFTRNTCGFAPDASSAQNEKLAMECDSLVALAIAFGGDSLSYKVQTETLLSSFYIFNRRINGRLLIECYHVPTFSQSGRHFDMWSEAVDFYKAMYDPYYEYAGSTPYIFSFVKRSVIDMYRHPLSTHHLGGIAP